jgi:hypothetical protein
LTKLDTRFGQVKTYSQPFHRARNDYLRVRWVRDLQNV